MRYLSVLTFLLLTVSLSSYSQTEWAPIGAQWHYCFGVPFDGVSGYVTLHSVSDTIIDSKTCKKIIRVSSYQLVHNPKVFTSYDGFYIMYSNQGKVYNYYLDKFHLLYDFSLNAGDTLRAQLNPSNKNDSVFTNYKIDSVDYKNFNGKNLKRQFFHNIDSIPPIPDYWFYDGYFIENAGYKGWLLGSIGIDIDGFWARLRCYSDSSVSFNLNPVISCDSIENPYIGIEDITKQEILIQNPVNYELILQYSGLKPFNILIINNIGVQMACLNKVSSEQLIIPTDLFTKGIYYLILFNNKTRLIKKFVKL